MPGRLFITPRDSAPCISRPLSRPEGPASRSATPNASNTTAVPQPRHSRKAHGKRAAHQTRDALETAATVSSPLRHRDRAKSRKNSSLVPSQAPRPHTTEGREGWDSYYVLQGRGGKRGERWGWAASQGGGRKGGKDGATIAAFRSEATEGIAAQLRKGIRPLLPWGCRGIMAILWRLI